MPRTKLEGAGRQVNPLDFDNEEELKAAIDERLARISLQSDINTILDNVKDLTEPNKVLINCVLGCL